MLKFTSYKSLATYVLAFLFILSSCKKDKNSYMENTVAGPDLNLYALTADAKLLLLNAKILPVLLQKSPLLDCKRVKHC